MSQDANVKAQELKDDRSLKKRKVTTHASKLKNAIECKKDLQFVESVASELDNCFYEFEDAHSTYVDFVSDNEALANFKVVNGMTLDEYSENVTATYKSVCQSYRAYKDELHESLKLYNELQVKGQIKRIEKLCANVTSVATDPLKDKANILLFIRKELEPAVDKLQMFLTKLSDAKDYYGAVDAIVEKVDDVKLMCAIESPLSGYDVTIKSEALGTTLTDSDSQIIADSASSTSQPTSSIVSSSGIDTSQIQTSSDLVSTPQNTMGANSVSGGASVYSPTFGGSLTSIGSSLPYTSGVNQFSQGPSTMVSGFLPTSNVSSMPVPSSFSTSLPLPRPSASSAFQTTGFSYSGQSAPLVNPTAPRFSDIHVKRTSLPEFTGLRKDWPEFRAVWRELAEGAFSSKATLAYELKKSLKGQAADRVRNIFITRPEAYDLMWLRLSEYYDDCSAAVQSALENLHKLKPVSEDDFKGIVRLVDEVEATYAQLLELGQSETLSVREIDRVCELLPSSTRMVWNRLYHQLKETDKLRPLEEFMTFLTTERASVVRLAEIQKKIPQKNSSHAALGKTSDQGNGKKSVNCSIHPSGKHKLCDCKEFKSLNLDDKFKLLRESHLCFRCFEPHRRDKCRERSKCEHCGRTNHHSLLCRKLEPEVQNTSKTTATASSNATRSPEVVSLYAIQQAETLNNHKLTVFCDNGSNSTYITHQAAERVKASKLERFSLEVTTMGNRNKTYDTWLYEVPLKTITGKTVHVQAFGMGEITGPVSKIDVGCLQNIFASRTCEELEGLQRHSSTVDLLLGCDYFGLHPKKEICSDGHLSIMEGELGECLQGSHPSLKEETSYSLNMVRALHTTKLSHACNHVSLTQSHPEFSYPSRHSDPKEASAVCMMNKTTHNQLDFLQGEELAVEIVPKCGACKCGKCPSVGHTYSFREEQELNLIRSNLTYDDKNECWMTKYPWIIDPTQLPDNYSTALATLKSTEYTLSKDKNWAQLYSDQIQDMLQRNVARKLSPEEVKSWSGPVFYICHLAVCNSKSNSTPVRIVFNSSQKCQGISLNAALAKGPDGYMNNLVGLLLRWREESVGVVGDIRKMFHSVHLEELEQHCHRFLWRDLIIDKPPDIYVMLRVNMGDKPAPAICTEAIYLTADKFQDISPQAAQLLKKNTYVDDIVDSFPSRETAVDVIEKTEQMLQKGGFKIKCWKMSGGEEVLPERGLVSMTEIGSNTVPLLKGDEHVTRVLGVSWNSHDDIILFQVNLNFSQKKKGERMGRNLTADDIPGAIPDVLTRRIVLEQVMSIFDPLGLLCPFTLIAKLCLRETWEKKLDWDDPLPPDLREKWMRFFGCLFQIEDLKFDRSLRPPNSVGKPWLIIFSDGSDLAYGAAAYIRWQLANGDVWCRLIMAKCKIAPMTKLTTPQMELNGAVISKRMRKVLEKEMRCQFEKTLHIVDSETVLNMLHKTSTRFKIYEGVRIGEIQTATNGIMDSWAWIAGEHNTADILTRGCMPDRLGPESDWYQGPPVIYKPIEMWNLKFGLQRQDCQLPGEKKVVNASVADVKFSSTLSQCVDFERFSSISKLYWVVARLLGIFKMKSFRGGNTELISPDLLRKAENLVVKDVQRKIEVELNNRKGSFAALQPKLDDEGFWIVGTRLQNNNPMSLDGKPQRLMPYHDYITHLIMKRAHEQSGHRGRDATLARFRQSFWVPRGSKLASCVKNKCQLCKLREPKLLSQQMGMLPEDRLKPGPPFTKVMVDLFGPYKVRGEVQKRTSGKAYGVIFTDMVMRAVHIEVAFGYDTKSFLLALQRFASVRGWPETLYSDPGSQLVGADNELKAAWTRIDKTALNRVGADNGTKWIFGPPDSPWHQGAVESLIKSVKKSIHFAIHNQRLSPMEFLTICAEVSNLLNERPIGSIPGSDSEINILTPNCLLIGRPFAKNPGDWVTPNDDLALAYESVQLAVNSFWKRWVEFCAPALAIHKKWLTEHRNLQPGDVVMIADQNSLRGEYRLGLVKEVFPGKDGKVRKVALSYKSFRVGSGHKLYGGGSDTVIIRSVQKLALLVPVNDG